MTVLQPLWLLKEDVPELPDGWQALTTVEAADQFKPGKLYDQKTSSPEGEVPVVNQSLDGFVGYHSDEPGVFASIDKPVVTFANHTCAMRLMKQPFSCIQNIFPKVGRQGVCDTRYFYYAAMGRVDLSDYKGHHPLFRQAYIPVPPLPIQQRISAILTAYDDLIENNTRRVAILEEMARRLYEEWFVHFRFPGHEEMEFDGEFPMGWLTVQLKQVARLRSGYAFKRETFTEGDGQRLVTIKNVQDGAFDPDNVNQIDAVPFNVPQHCFLKSGHLLLSLTGNVGRVCVVYGGDFLLNQRVAKIEPLTSDLRSFVYFTFRDTSFRKRLENLASGVAQQNLSPVKTEELPITLPPLRLTDRFEDFAGPVMSECTLLNEKNANLRAQRDLLLPKLVSGEIDVSEAEAKLEAAE